MKLCNFALLIALVVIFSCSVDARFKMKKTKKFFQNLSSKVSSSFGKKKSSSSKSHPNPASLSYPRQQHPYITEIKPSAPKLPQNLYSAPPGNIHTARVGGVHANANPQGFGHAYGNVGHTHLASNTNPHGAIHPYGSVAHSQFRPASKNNSSDSLGEFVSSVIGGAVKKIVKKKNRITTTPRSIIRNQQTVILELRQPSKQTVCLFLNGTYILDPSYVTQPHNSTCYYLTPKVELQPQQSVEKTPLAPLNPVPTISINTPILHQSTQIQRSGSDSLYSKPLVFSAFLTILFAHCLR